MRSHFNFTFLFLLFINFFFNSYSFDIGADDEGFEDIFSEDMGGRVNFSEDIINPEVGPDQKKEEAPRPIEYPEVRYKVINPEQEISEPAVDTSIKIPLEDVPVEDISLENDESDGIVTIPELEIIEDQ